MKATRFTNNQNNDNKPSNGQVKPIADGDIALTGPTEIHFTIKDLADFSGIKSHTIRIWEQRFSFLSPQRTETSRRFYTGPQVIFFLQVCLLKQDGYRMSHIARMSDEERSEIIEAISGPQKYIRIIYELISCMINMNAFRFNAILDNCVREWGIHETLECVILPFTERTCLFDNIDKKPFRANLLLVTECIKPKIYLGIESVTATSREQRTVLIFPAGSGDLPLLYIHYLVKKEGFRPIYLGKYSSFSDLTTICNRKKPDFIITHLVENHRSMDLAEFIRNVASSLPRTQFISSGRPLPFEKKVQYYHHIEKAVAVVPLLRSLNERSV